MRVGILGPLQVEAGGVPVAVGGPRVRALLVRLALDVGHTVTLDAIGSALWPGRAPAQPANAVQTLVSRLRKALPDGTVVRSVAEGYRLELAPEAVDAVRFERLAGQGRRALAGGDARAAAERLREALALWRGEALAGVADAPYAAAAATRLIELRVAAIEYRIAAELPTEPPDPLVAELRQLATAYPQRERVRALLVRALHAAGRSAEALAAYEQFRRTLADELGADPGPELREAHLRVLRGEPASPSGAGPVSRGNLRVELTSFVGRDEQRRQVAAQLMGGQRLVTLVGPGGAGKTRLATTVAADLAGTVEGGAWLVELAPLTDPAVQPRVLLAAARAQQGDRARARAELRELVAPGVRARTASYLVLARISLGDLARLDGDLVEAARQYDAAGVELARVPYDTSLFRAMLLCARGHRAAAAGDLDGARWQLAEAFARAVETPDLPVAADVAVAVVRLRWRAGSSEAAQLLGAAHALRGSPDAYDPDVVELADGLRATLRPGSGPSPGGGGGAGPGSDVEPTGYCSDLSRRDVVVAAEQVGRVVLRLDRP